MDRDVRIALVSCRSVIGDTTGNLCRMEQWIRAAGNQGVHLVCFPELSITGYHVRPPIDTVAESIDGPCSARLADLAEKHNISILAGMAERSGNRIYAAHLMAHPDSEHCCVYRKLHLGPTEKEFFSPASKIPPLFEACGLRIGVQLCYDAHFPELSTHMAINNADLLIIAHASPGKSSGAKLDSWMRHLPARAFDNGVYVAAVNAAGDNGFGLSFPPVCVLIGPEGKILESYADADEYMLTADLSAQQLRAVRDHPMKYFLPNRRPEIYQEKQSAGSTE
ncbi:MAG: nitrilase [Desulfobacteraceae bacterium]|nr:nitrilase [Desulfobacteraceae bacterium]